MVLGDFFAAWVVGKEDFGASVIYLLVALFLGTLIVPGIFIFVFGLGANVFPPLIFIGAGLAALSGIGVRFLWLTRALGESTSEATTVIVAGIVFNIIIFAGIGFLFFTGIMTLAGLAGVFG